MNKTQKNLEQRVREAQILNQEHLRLVEENALMIDFVYLSAASKRLDGTYNNCREALEKKAKLVLDKLSL